MTKPKIGIMGVGWVGGQLKKYLEEIKGYQLGKNLFIYSRDSKKCVGDIQAAEIIFITLPTPRKAKDGSCDISIIEKSLKKIGGRKIIVIKSTVAPGTTASFQKKYKQHKFLFNPEFLTEANAWQDMLNPDRQIVGFLGKNKDAAELVLSLLPRAPLMSPGIYGNQELKISATEAEIIKYAGNIFLARKINWANALAISTEALGGNYNNVRLGFGADKRIGHSHLNVDYSGYRGFGGYCFPKDLDGFMGFVRRKKLKEVLVLLQADRDFNETLLKKQGLSLQEVSGHIDQVEEIIKKKKKTRH